MKFDEETKKISLELEKMKERSKQICRILDKDDIRVDLINDIGKKRYVKSDCSNNNLNSKRLPNLIYYNGPVSISSKIFMENNKFVPNFKSTSKKDTDKETKFNDLLLSNGFQRVAEGAPSLLYKTMTYFHKNNNRTKNVSNLAMFYPSVYEKNKKTYSRLPYYYKVLKKDYEFNNNQRILDQINECRYHKKNDAFRFSPLISQNYFETGRNFHSKKVTDFDMKKTLMLFHTKSKTLYNINQRKKDEVINIKQMTENVN